MKLQFARHARNRMRLYNIGIEDVEAVFRDPLAGPVAEGSRVVLLGKPMVKFAHRSLKIIYVEEQGVAVFATVLRSSAWVAIL